MNESLPNIVIFNFDPKGADFYVKTAPKELYHQEDFEPKAGVEVLIIVKSGKKSQNVWIIEGSIEQYEGKKSLLGSKVCISGSISPQIVKGASLHTPLGTISRL